MTRLIWSSDAPSGREPADKALSAERNARPPAGSGRRALRAGEHAPRFRLPDQHGRAVMLGALAVKGPVVLRFCRHDGSSSCFLELDDLVRTNIEIQKLNSTLVVIAAQPLHPHSADRNFSSYDFPILSDKDGKVAKSFGLTYKRPQAGRQFLVATDTNARSRRRVGTGSAPATYVIDRECVVALTFVDLEGASRMEPDQILMALDCLHRRRKPKHGASVEAQTPDDADRPG